MEGGQRRDGRIKKGREDKRGRTKDGREDKGWKGGQRRERGMLHKQEGKKERDK
jgi:hypothetical protein